MAKPSAASLTVLSSVTSIQRPKPPSELTPEEASEWRALVNVLPADQYSPDTYPALIQLCRHKVNARRLALMKQQCIEKCDTVTELHIMEAEEKQSRIIASLMTKLRITPQSRYDAKKKRGPSIGKPWQFEN